MLVFPGQTSRYPGLLERPLRLQPDLAEPVLAEASEVLGRDVRAQYRADAPEPFRSNRDVQVGVFLANHLYLTLLEGTGIHAALSLGHSLGEYNHLVHIGALAFGDALRLVEARGRAYDAGPAGAMAVVFPLELDELAGIVERAQITGSIEIGAYNSANQHVLSGERAAIEAAIALIADETYAEAAVIEPRIPMHCSRFAPVAGMLRPALLAAPWRTPRLPYLPNVLVQPLEQPGPDGFVDLLSRHVYQPVRWSAWMDELIRREPQTLFLEVGPRAALTSLIRRGWPEQQALATDAEGQPLEAVLEIIKGAS